MHQRASNSGHAGGGVAGATSPHGGRLGPGPLTSITSMRGAHAGLRVSVTGLPGSGGSGMPSPGGPLSAGHHGGSGSQPGTPRGAASPSPLMGRLRSTRFGGAASPAFRTAAAGGGDGALDSDSVLDGGDAVVVASPQQQQQQLQRGFPAAASPKAGVGQLRERWWRDAVVRVDACLTKRYKKTQLRLVEGLQVGLAVRVGWGRGMSGFGRVGSAVWVHGPARRCVQRAPCSRTSARGAGDAGFKPCQTVIRVHVMRHDVMMPMHGSCAAPRSGPKDQSTRLPRRPATGPRAQDTHAPNYDVYAVQLLDLASSGGGPRPEGGDGAV